MEKRTKIVHFDDHQLFLKGLANGVYHKFPDVNFIAFSDTDEAFYYVVNSIVKNQQIDLLILDFNHPGLNGYEFAKAVRTIERFHGSKPIPIMLLTMVPGGTLISKALEEGIFTVHLTKDSDADMISQRILQLL